MSDIVSELLDRAYSHKPNDFLCERAAMEIERLRTLATHATPSDGSVPRNGSAESRETVCPQTAGESHMSSTLILCVGFVYLMVGIDQWCKGSPGMAIAWWGYALANVGLAMSAK